MMVLLALFVENMEISYFVEPDSSFFHNPYSLDRVSFYTGLEYMNWADYSVGWLFFAKNFKLIHMAVALGSVYLPSFPEYDDNGNLIDYRDFVDSAFKFQLSMDVLKFFSDRLPESMWRWKKLYVSVGGNGAYGYFAGDSYASLSGATGVAFAFQAYDFSIYNRANFIVAVLVSGFGPDVFHEGERSFYAPLTVDAIWDYSPLLNSHLGVVMRSVYGVYGFSLFLTHGFALPFAKGLRVNIEGMLPLGDNPVRTLGYSAGVKLQIQSRLNLFVFRSGVKLWEAGISPYATFSFSRIVME